MFKKIPALLTAILLLFGIASLPAFAETTADYIVNFNNLQNGAVYNWKSINPDNADDYSRYGIKTSVVGGVGVKYEDDLSLKLSPVSNYALFRAQQKIYGHTTIEYSFYTDASNAQILLAKYPYTNMGFPIFDNSVFKLGSTEILTGTASRWYRVAIELNCGLEAVNGIESGKYNYYIDGVKYLDNETLPSVFTANDWNDISFYAPSGRGDVCIDDIYVHDGSYNPLTVSVNSGSADITVDNSGKTISLPQNLMSGTEFAALFTASEGAEILGVYRDSVGYIESRNVKSGDKLIVNANNIYVCYEIKESGNTTKNYFADFNTATDGDYHWADIIKNGAWTYYAYGILTSVSGRVGGKAESDKSVKLFPPSGKSGTPYLMTKDHAFYGITSIEFNVYPTSADCYGRLDTPGNMFGIPFLQDGKIGGIYTYEPNKWYKVVYEFNVEIDAQDIDTGSFNMYVNGEKIVSNKKMTSSFTAGKGNELRFYNYNSNLPFYLDDISIQSGRYDAAESAVGAVSDKYKVLDGAVLFADVTGTEYAGGFTATNGGSIAGVVNSSGELITDKKISIGDYLMLRSVDGTYKYLKIADGATIISTGKYTLDSSSKEISGIGRNTSVKAFKNALVCMDETTVKTVKNGNVVVNDGVLQSGMTLTVGNETYTLEFKEDIVNDTYTGKTGTKITDYKNGAQDSSSQAALAGFGLNYTTFDETSSYAEVVTDPEKNSEVLKLYNNDSAKSTFIGRNITSGLNDSFTLEFSMKKDSKLSPRKVFLRGTSESAPTGYDNILGGAFINMETDGMIYFIDRAVGVWDLNKWYRFALQCDIPNNKYTLYINGTKVSDYSFEEGSKINKVWYIRFEANKTAGEDNTYLDDVLLYHTDEMFEENALKAAVYSDTRKVIPAYGMGAVYINAGETVGDVAGSISYTGRTPVLYNEDGSEIQDAEVSALDGMYIKVRSYDGLAEASYAFVKGDSVSVSFKNAGGEILTKTQNGNIDVLLSAISTKSDAPKRAYFIAAVYENDRLISVDTNEISLAVSGDKAVRKINTSLKLNVTDASKQTVKAFFWSSSDALQPLLAEPAYLPSGTSF